MVLFLRIGFDVQPFFWPKISDGVAHYNRSLLAALMPMKRHDLVLCLGRGEPQANAFFAGLPKVPEFRFSGGRSSPVREDFFAWTARKAFRGAEHFFFDFFGVPAKCGFGADLQVFHSNHGILSLNEGSKNVVTVHDLIGLVQRQGAYPHDARFTAGKRQIAKFAGHCDAVIAISEAAKLDLVSLGLVDPENVHVVYCGKSSFFRPVRAERLVSASLEKFGLSRGNYFLSVSAFLPHKNALGALTAFASFMESDSAGENFSLVFVAGNHLDSGYAAKIRRAAKALGVSDRVKLLGFVEDNDLRCLYNGALALVYPSFCEGFGLPLVEAMACGTPVIASDVSAMPEVCGNAALLVDPYDAGSIARAMGDVHSDASLRKRLGRLGIKRASFFSWEKSAKGVAAVYESLF